MCLCRFSLPSPSSPSLSLSLSPFPPFFLLFPSYRAFAIIARSILSSGIFSISLPLSLSLSLSLCRSLDLWVLFAFRFSYLTRERIYVILEFCSVRNRGRAGAMVSWAVAPKAEGHERVRERGGREGRERGWEGGRETERKRKRRMDSERYPPTLRTIGGVQVSVVVRSAVRPSGVSLSVAARSKPTTVATATSRHLFLTARMFR